ncbi:hypothetical protein BH23GEM5_BH23GEM5_23980 [soil metagenome]
MELQSFLQCLAIHLTGWQATTFLVGEYTDVETRDNPVFTVADGVLRLSQSVDRNSIVRKLQVVKSRGKGSSGKFSLWSRCAAANTARIFGPTRSAPVDW